MDQQTDLQAQADNLLLRDVGTRALGGEPFSIFNPSHIARATELAAQLGELATANPGQGGVQEALAAARAAAANEDPDLVKHAIMLFITHHPQARELTIPALEERNPDVLTSIEDSEASTRALDAEEGLRWFREDALANEHHEHWHLVYPAGGLNGRLKDRQGELFVYMHQQMIARYDAERLALGLPRVLPLSDYRAPIAEGYDPGPALRARYPARPSGVAMRDRGSYTVAGHEALRDALTAAVGAGLFRRDDNSNLPMDIDRLGSTVEATAGSVAPRRYGQLHNMGHMLIAALSAGRDGVMSGVSTAIRDPVFWRWHKHIDDFAARWQDAQPAHDFSDAPNVRIRKNLGSAREVNASPDIILSFGDQIPAGQNPQAWGQSTFGGPNWDKRFATGPTSTNELHTMMLRRQTTAGAVEYLDHREFAYFLRLENRATTPTDVTVRLFLAPRATAADRRAWIELDKFRQSLSAGQKLVVYRPAAQATVIRKPAIRPPAPARTLPRTDDEYCNCGWPYNLLIPRGNQAGMPFRLLVMLTSWQRDRVEQEDTCGSMSFCGSRQRYPDTRPMGYPFDRPFGGRSLAQLVAAQANIATRDITIRWVS